jgi:predicted proteasome-type protease
VTYCIGILVDEGVVLASDSRTNAGIDRVSTFCKMFSRGTAFSRCSPPAIFHSPKA